MPEIGQILSHFRLLEKIGQGGMGEVYLADDTTLDRKVALKFLPDAFTSDPERMARFEREAKLLASLNHPNIAGIYGLEQAEGNKFLVLEYVEGETLQARLSKGALPLEDALELCRQIAEGLEAAHEKGVIHRDLKPANVMITAEEKVKILDFGLAKALSDDTQSIDSSKSPTLTEAMTQPGVILGTAAYMSPEQAKGKSVDKRADIWAFGCILYECLTGKKAFRGETVTETLAAIIRGEPDWDALPSTLSLNIRKLIRRCMYKDQKKRLPHIGNVRIEIDESDIEAFSVPVMPKIQVWRERVAWIAIAFLAAIALFLGYKINQKAGPAVTSPAVRFELPLPDQLFGLEASELSPDGRSIAYRKRSENLYQLAVINLTTLDVTTISDSGGASDLFWKPDGRAIGFRSRDGSLKTVEIDGGTPHSLPIGNLSVREGGASWAADGTILFASDDGIFKFDRSEAVPQQVTSINRSLKEEAHLYPKFLVDNHRFLYTVTGSDEASPSIYIASIDGSTPQFVVEGSGAIYLSGYLLYVQDGRLLVCACDQNSMKPSAEPIEIASGISISDTRGPAFSAAASGLVVYSTSGLRQRVQLTEYDRLGATLRMIGDPDRYSNPALSPDQKSLLCSVEGESSMQRGNIYRLQLDSGNRSRFTYGGCENDPVWSPDGTQFAYSSLCEGDYGIYIMDAIPDGKAKKLFESEVIVYPTDWAKDERFLLYTRVDPKTGRDLWIWSFLDEKESSLVKTQGIDDMGVFSPDGDWIAYSSEETGRSEIYIRPRGHSDFKLQVTSEGGRQPRWGPDGEELFFASADGTALYSSLIKYNPSPEKSTPRKLFDVNLSEISQSQWVVTKDGQRFIVQTLKEENIDRLKAISNWLDLVR